MLEKLNGNVPDKISKRLTKFLHIIIGETEHMFKYFTTIKSLQTKIRVHKRHIHYLEKVIADKDKEIEQLKKQIGVTLRTGDKLYHN